MPRFLFVVERNRSMNAPWAGNASQPSRWDVMVDSVIAAVNTAPVEVDFALVATDNSAQGWYQVSAFDHPDVHLTRSLITAPIHQIRTRRIANALHGVLDDYLSIGVNGQANREWRQAPFTEPCSSVEVIVITDGIGDDGDDSARNQGFDGDVMPDRICADADDCSNLSENGYTLLDDVAWLAANTDLNRRLGGVQTVRVHTILLDASTQSSTLAEDLLASTAEVSGGLYVRAEQPEDVSLGITLAMTDAMQSVLNVSAAVTAVTGHRLFRTWTEIPAGADGEVGTPLFRGHLEAFQVNNRANDPDYGAIGEEPLWDAAELLSQRRAATGAYNSYTYASADAAVHERTLFTNPAQGGVYQPRDLLPFDATRIEELGELILPGYDRNVPGTFGCPDYPRGDLDHDCDVDEHDAQLAVDFLRGVADTRFPGTSALTSRERGAWRMGGMFLSMPAFSNSHSLEYTDDVGRIAFQQKLMQRDAVVYVTSNDGFLHAFRVPLLDGDGDGWEDGNSDSFGGWELWGYIPRHLLDHESAYHDDLHSALNLILDGESYLNDGSVNLADVWMDGVPNRLDGECATADADGRIDADGCEHHRVLVASMGMGSRYHYALDVTVPTQPRFLWEWLGDRDGWRKGLGAGTPIITTVYDADSGSDVPVVIWSNGTVDADDNVPERPRWPVPSERQGNVSGVGSRWYMFNLLDPPDATFSQVGYQVDGSLSPYTRGRRDPRYVISDPAGGLFGTPAAVDYDEDGTTDALYIGSRHGTLIKVLIDHGELSPASMESIDGATGGTCVFHAAPEIQDLRDVDDDNQAVYFRPSVSRDNTGRIRVSWGTGWPGNVAEPYDTGYLYSVTDGVVPGDEWSCNASTVSSCGPAFDPYQLEPGEKLVGPVLTHAGRILFTTYVADNASEGGPACGVGHARVHALTLDDCMGGFEEGRDWGPSNFAVTDGRFVEVEGIPSRMSFANQGIYLSVVKPDGSMDAIGPIRPESPEVGADRVAFTNWRHVL